MTDVTTAVKNALAADVVRQEWFVTIAFPSGTRRLWSGSGNYTLSGNVYQGTSSLGQIVPITDTAADGMTTFNAQRVQMTLSGVDPAFAADAASVDHQGSAVTIIAAWFDASATLIADPVNFFDGAIDTMGLQIGGEPLTATITAECDNFLSYMFRGPDGQRRTPASQQGIYSGDTFFSFDGTQPNQIPWGTGGSVLAPPSHLGTFAHFA